MICPSCNQKLEPDTRFCTVCGYRLTRDELDAHVASTVRELVQGNVLRALMVDGPMFWRRALELVEELCAAVIEARACGIQHPDLSPDSIYVDHRPGTPRRIKLVDASVDLMRGNEPRDTAMTYRALDKYGRSSMPSLDYMAPEQVMGKTLDESTGVYTLGVIAYELLTGRRPFADAKGPAGLITAQLKRVPVPPSMIAPDAGIPPAVDALVLRCLRKVRAERYADTSFLANEIAEVLQTGRLPDDDAPNVS